jgi:hypothetical protein
VRNTFKYGDCFFIRDPETKKLLYVDQAKVSKIIVNESEGKFQNSMWLETSISTSRI